MIVFIKLLLAHLIGDFVLQPTRWMIHKEANKIKSKYLYLHIVLHFAITMLLLWDYTFWKLLLIIVVSHYFIDLGKLYSNRLFKNKATPFFVDQLLHVAVLYVCAFYGNVFGQTMSIIDSIDWPLVTSVVFLSFSIGHNNGAINGGGCPVRLN